MTRGWWVLMGLLPWLGPSVAAAQERRYDWGWGMHPMWGVWGIGMMLMMFVFWGVVIVGIVVVVRWLARQGTERRSPDAALDVLRQRYARGDIEKDEFETRKRDLT